jgi:hypothetical protein
MIAVDSIATLPLDAIAMQRGTWCRPSGLRA